MRERPRENIVPRLVMADRSKVGRERPIVLAVDLESLRLGPATFPRDAMKTLRSPAFSLCAIWGTFSLAVPVAAAPPPPSTVQAAPAAETSSPASSDWIDIRVAPTIDEPNMATWLRDRSDQAVARLTAGEQQPGWRIDLDVSGVSYDYRLKVDAFRNAKLVGPPSTAIVCSCTSEELLQKVDEELARAVDRLRQAEHDAMASAPPPDEPPVPTYRADSTAHEPRGGVGAPGIVGIVTTGLGAGLLAYGLTMTLKGEEIVSENPEQIRIRNHSNPGTHAVLGIGAGLLAAGITLLVVDQVVCKSRPRGCRRLPPPYAGARPALLRF